MRGTEKPKVVRSEQARERMRAAARIRHDANTRKIHERVRNAMRLIHEEIAANQSIYPNNKGSVTLAEVARRARMHPVTFHKPHYRELAEEVKAWINTLKSDAIVGHKRIYKEVGSRIQEWKRLYEDLLDNYHISETDLAYATAQLQELEQENKLLRQKLADATKLKVVALRSKRN